MGKFLCIDDKKRNYISVGYKFNGSGLLKAKSHTRFSVNANFWKYMYICDIAAPTCIKGTASLL